MGDNSVEMSSRHLRVLVGSRKKIRVGQMHPGLGGGAPQDRCWGLRREEGHDSDLVAGRGGAFGENVVKCCKGLGDDEGRQGPTVLGRGVDVSSVGDIYWDNFSGAMGVDTILQWVEE